MNQSIVEALIYTTLKINNAFNFSLMEKKANFLFANFSELF